MLVDSGATAQHMVNDISWFDKLNLLSGKVKAAGGSKLDIRGEGRVRYKGQIMSTQAQQRNETEHVTEYTIGGESLWISPCWLGHCLRCGHCLPETSHSSFDPQPPASA